nr:2-amino-4-hydroxy-6-hydroxymethyldihydropteridine diphosphokinase [Gorillibacterium massiliense]
MKRRRPVEACISLGSNLGDRMDYLERAIRLLDQHPNVSVLRRSAVYETDPVGYTDQGPFLNMAVAVKTDLTAEELLAFMLETEQVLGRVREIRFGPRTLDLDLILYGKEIKGTPQLTVPHPRMGERAFVLIPLAEIVADDAVPGIDSLAERLKHLEGKDGVRIWIA